MLQETDEAVLGSEAGVAGVLEAKVAVFLGVSGMAAGALMSRVPKHRQGSDNRHRPRATP